MKTRWSAALLLVLLGGCFKVKDELALQADGSGTVRIETRSGLPAEMLDGMGLGARMGALGGNEAIYPPVSEAEARKFFPGKDFTVTVKAEKSDDGGTLTVIDAAFKDVNALLASPYGHAHALTLQIENGALTLKAVTGVEAAARLADVKDESGMFGGEMAGLADLQKKKGEMRAEFRVTLPNTLTSATGARDGRTASWVVERAKAKDGEAFAQEAGAALEASCSAEGLKMSPVTPVRLGARPFKELAAGATVDKTATPDAKKIAAAAKFAPYALHVTRSLDLSGEGGGQQNQAQLFGAVVLPQEFAPDKWGEVKLEEVVDARGNSLKSGEDRDNFGFNRHARFGGEDDAEDKDEPDGGAEQRRPVALRFQPPDWKIKAIARIKGSMTLQYFGGARVVKLTNAVPAKWILDAREAMNMRGDPGEKSLNDPQLPELGLALRFQMGMAQSGFTMLMLGVSSQKAVLSGVQVFDAEGRPWPTFMREYEMGEEGSCSVMVAGRPQPPLSLALLASGVGATVEVPILLEHVPVGGK